MPSPAYESDNYSVDSFRFLLVNFDSEDLEKYRQGGFHPVHLGDLYCEKRYRIVHKLGSGGFSTVWLARDEVKEAWVALKIAIAEASTSIESKSLLSVNAVRACGNVEGFGVQHESFATDGPNGRHICLVFPVLGPSTSQLSSGLSSRMSPSLSRRAVYQATKALADLHAQGVCHGDMTTANIIFGMELETESGEPTGPEAPRYIVKALDFLSASVNHVSKDVKIIDFDQAFPASSPPKKLLGTPAEFLAPEVAVGRPAGPASDVRALGCSIFRMRSGESPFSGYEVTSPADLMQFIVRSIGNIPDSWGEILFDYDGRPTTDHKKGRPLELRGESRPIIDLVRSVWDRPQNDFVETGKIREEFGAHDPGRREQYPSCFSDMFWKPSAIRIDNVFLHGYDDETDELLQAMPKISEEEAVLLYDLLSKIFVYHPADRITAAEMLKHPWFSLDG